MSDSFFVFLDVVGEDVSTFLQSQTSNDIFALNGLCGQLSSYSNAKGRLWWNGLIWKLSEQHFRMLLPRNGATRVIQRLSMFILRSKVTLSPIDQPTVVFQFPKPECDHAHHQNSIHLFGDVWVGLIDSITKNSLILSEDEWMSLSIQAGFAWVTEPTQEKWVAQMIHWDILGGVSFKKGCYPGQEIIARMHYLGKAKKGLVQVVSSNSLEVFQDIFSQNFQGQPVGQVVNVAKIEQRYYAICVVAHDALAHGLFLDDLCTHPLSLLASS